jgi:hypothetical protein
MAARITQAARIDALEKSIATLVAALTPAVAAPAKAKAESPFVGYLRERQAAHTATPEGFEPCGVHAACSRSFRKGSKGEAQHEARVYAADGSYTIGS